MNNARAVIELSKDDEWETPPELLKNVCTQHQVFPELDVCCTNQNHKCDYWFTKQEDALTKDWTKYFFIPYQHHNEGNLLVFCYIFYYKPHKS